MSVISGRGGRGGDATSFDASAAGGDAVTSRMVQGRARRGKAARPLLDSVVAEAIFAAESHP
jgi:hypothetical protein